MGRARKGQRLKAIAKIAQIHALAKKVIQ